MHDLLLLASAKQLESQLLTTTTIYRLKYLEENLQSTSTSFGSTITALSKVGVRIGNISAW
jgi:hypothetical protein